MPRVLAILFATIALVLAACGGGGGDGAGASPAASIPGATTVTGGDTPPGSTVFFGSAYDPITFAVADKTSRIKPGDPVVAVGKALAPVDGTGVQLELKLNGKAKALRAPDAMDNPTTASFFGSDLSADGLTAGTWIVSFVNAQGRVLASGFLSVAP
ncbi:MAG TPA: hypothetical protein VES19_06230 [Candidatus Limnocylindrales bacterium]|nr:hypothetical protein [Candidatus Limnocylindrales bacterium]